jgi:hypothetical protein
MLDTFEQYTLAESIDWKLLYRYYGKVLYNKAARLATEGKVRVLRAFLNVGIVAWVQDVEREVVLFNLVPFAFQTKCTCSAGKEDMVCEHSLAAAMIYLSMIENDEKIRKINQFDSRLPILNNLEFPEDYCGDSIIEGEEEKPIYPKKPIPLSPDEFIDKDMLNYYKNLGKEELGNFLTDLCLANHDYYRKLEVNYVINSKAVNKLVNNAKILIRRAFKTIDFDFQNGGFIFNDDLLRVEDIVEHFHKFNKTEQLIEIGREIVEYSKDFADHMRSLDMKIEVSEDELESYYEEDFESLDRWEKVDLIVKKVSYECDKGLLENMEQARNTVRHIFRLINFAISESELPQKEKLELLYNFKSKDYLGVMFIPEKIWEIKEKGIDWADVTDNFIKRYKNVRNRGDEVLFGNISKAVKNGDYLNNEFGVDDLSEIVPIEIEREAILHFLDKSVELSGKEEKLFAMLENIDEDGERVFDEVMLHLKYLAKKKRWSEYKSLLDEYLNEENEEEVSQYLSVEVYPMMDMTDSVSLLTIGFFLEPSIERYHKVKEQSRLLGVWPAVMGILLKFLKTGEIPKEDIPYLRGISLSKIHLSRTNNVLRGKVIMDILSREASHPELKGFFDFDDVKGFFGNNQNAGEVADNILGSFPEKSISIWDSIVKDLIEQGTEKDYKKCEKYLKKIRVAYEQMDNVKKWKEYITSLKNENTNKKKLLSILNKIN